MSGRRVVQAFVPMNPPTVTHNDLRAVTHKGRPCIIKSDRLREAEGDIEARLARSRPDTPMDGPLRLTVAWCFHPTGDHRDGSPMCVVPDLSNLMKTFEDCMTRTGIIRDDSLIAEERITKAWSDPAGIFFKVEELT